MALFNTSDTVQPQQFNAAPTESNSPWMKYLGFNPDGTKTDVGKVLSWVPGVGLATDAIGNTIDQGTDAHKTSTGYIKGDVDKLLGEAAIAATVLGVGAPALAGLGAAGAGAGIGAGAVDAGAIGTDVAGATSGIGSVAAGGADVGATVADTAGAATDASSGITGLAPTTVGPTNAGTLSHLYNSPIGQYVKKQAMDTLQKQGTQALSNLANGKDNNTSQNSSTSFSLKNYNNY